VSDALPKSPKRMQTLTYRLEQPQQQRPAALPLHRALPPRTHALIGAYVLVSLLVVLLMF
jgi:hypothetical protein